MTQQYSYIKFERYNDLVVPVRMEYSLDAQGRGWYCSRVTEVAWSPLTFKPSGDAVDAGWDESADRTDPTDKRWHNAKHATFIGKEGCHFGYLPMTAEDKAIAAKRVAGLDNGDIDVQLLSESEEWFEENFAGI